MLYRTHHGIAMGNRVIPAGAVTTFNLSPAGIARLVDSGAISEVNAPPIAVLDGWRRRAEIAQQFGMVTLDEFIERPTSELAEIYRVKPKTVERWKQELTSFVTMPRRSGCG